MRESSGEPQAVPVAVEAMGGDLGSRVAVEGAVAAAHELGLSTVLVGLEEELRQHLRDLKAEDERLISIRHASEVVTMEDLAASAFRKKDDSSLRVALDLVKSGEASSVVSAGNTGAVMVAGRIILGSLPGIARPAIASLIPRIGDLPPTILVDCGANVDCHAQQLVQFALMGTYYARSVIGCDRPRVAILSNGTESSKGNDITRSAAMTLADLPNINYVGYIEGRDVSRDIADVVVCDGFVGNILLKSMEGTAELVFDSMRHYVERSFRGKIGLWLAKPSFKSLFREKLDPSAYGGAPLLGLNGGVIICHGSSNSRAIMNAIRVAQRFVDDNLAVRMASALSSLDDDLPGSSYEDGMWNRMGDRFDRRKMAQKNREEQAAKKATAQENDSSSNEPA